jgi:pimeloyl-ACP methyl ester carboxylesterase
MFFHGTPGNRHADYLGEWGRRFNIRFVVPERPGFGRSSFQRDRRLLDWPPIVSSLADHLGLDRFTVLGVSGGGPYSLACAYALPERVARAICVSGVGPPDAPVEGMSAANQQILAESLVQPGRQGAKLAIGYAIVPRFAERFVDKLPASMPEPDRVLRLRPDIRETFLQAMRTVRLRDARAAAHDFRTYARPWGFSLRDIRTHVDVWQGVDDTSVPVSTAQWMADQMPDASLTLVDDAGHLLVFGHWREILTAAGFVESAVAAS